MDQQPDVGENIFYVYPTKAMAGHIVFVGPYQL